MVTHEMAVTDPCCCCGDPFDPDDEDPDLTLCFGCLYHKIHKNICFECDDNEVALHASRFWDNIQEYENPDMHIFCSQSCRANFGFIMCLPRAFSVGKLSLSLKFQEQRNHESDYWVNTLMPVIFGAARDDDQHSVWNYIYQERKALLIPLLPTLAMTHLGHD